MGHRLTEEVRNSFWRVLNTRVRNLYFIKVGSGELLKVSEQGSDKIRIAL